MERADSEPGYRITGCSWERSSPETRRSFAELLKTPESGAASFCGLYFERFTLVHEVGHIALDLCVGEGGRGGAEEEYLANLFALKYFQYKNCDKYLSDLFRWIDYLLELYQVKIKFDLKAMDILFEKYRQDRRTYGALQFTCIREALKDPTPLQELMERLTCGRISALNSGVILRKDLSGADLVAECAQVVFGLSDAIPAIELNFAPELGAQKWERIG